jgi:hypothetical protein
MVPIKTYLNVILVNVFIYLLCYYVIIGLVYRV